MMKTSSPGLSKPRPNSHQRIEVPGHCRRRCELYKSGETERNTFLMRQDYRFLLLAPPQTRSGGAFGRSRINEQLYRQRLASVQDLRGRVYLKDGAIQRWELDDQGHFA